MNNKKNNGIKVIDYIISIILIVFSAYILTFYVFQKYLNLSYLVTTDNLNFILISFGQIIIPVVIGLGYIYIKNFKFINNHIKSFFSKISGKVILLGYALILGVGIIYNSLINYFGIELGKNIFDSFANTRNIKLLLLFTLLGILAAIYEELIFRGILFDFFKRTLSNIKNKLFSKNNKTNIIVISLTILITALLFGFLHMQYGIYLIIEVIIIGIILGIIRYKFGLINTILIHAINNFVIIFGTMLLPVVLNNVLFYKPIEIGKNVLMLKNNFDKEKNLFLEELIKNQVKENKGITNGKLIQKFLEENQDDLYNPYIYKYFFLPDGEFNKCIVGKDTYSKYCNKQVNKLYKKYEGYLKLYELGLINRYNYIQIQNFLNFIKRTFLLSNTGIKDKPKKDNISNNSSSNNKDK